MLEKYYIVFNENDIMNKSFYTFNKKDLEHFELPKSYPAIMYITTYKDSYYPEFDTIESLNEKLKKLI